MSIAPDKPRLPVYGEPTWEIAQLFPTQGTWSEAEYLALDTNHLVEFSDGFVEFLPMPTMTHQLIAHLFHCVLESFVLAYGLGTVVGAAFKVRMRDGKYREPDVVFMLTQHASRISNDFWIGADLVMEVVSDGDENRFRDLVTKRDEYAKAGILEYWIVDPELGQISVLALDGTSYAVHGDFKRGEQATSKLLPGFAVDVTSALAGKR
ncbi:MAG: Uma2 family endonuclease [Isosphaerales bacterium]